VNAAGRLLSGCAMLLAASRFVLSSDLPPTATPPPVAESTKELFSGQVVSAGEALRRKGLKPAEEMNGQMVLETDNGELIPILADWRGRSFYQDQRLRDRRVELVGSRKAGIPYLQVLMVFTFNDSGEREYTDYWCDTCAIPMYEIKPCECCQGEIRLRFQKQGLPEYLKPREKAEAK
jgi:hypothetical protein